MSQKKTKSKDNNHDINYKNIKQKIPHKRGPYRSYKWISKEDKKQIVKKMKTGKRGIVTKMSKKTGIPKNTLLYWKKTWKSSKIPCGKYRNSGAGSKTFLLHLTEGKFNF